MNRILFINLAVILILLLGGISANAQPAIDPSPIQSSQHLESLAQDTTLDVCMEIEPSSLYLYGAGDGGIREWILSAVYDGPIDSMSFDYQPVILQRLPSIENGDALLEAIIANEGETVLNDANQVVTLVDGEVIRPSGCRSSDCAITYHGGPVDMDRFRVNFYLLDGLTWSDGAPLTASDSEYSFNLDLDPVTPSDKYRALRTASYAATSDKQTTWIGRPGYTPSDYQTHFWTPLPQHLWGSYTAEELITADLSSRTPLGWGAYVIDEWIYGERISLHRNPNYFRAGEGLPHFERMIIHFVSDGIGELLAGNCDILPRSSADPKLLRIYDDHGYYKVASSYDGIAFEHLDFSIQPVEDYDGFAAQTLAFQDRRVRQAFAYCLDRQSIADSAFAGYVKVTNAYVPNIHPYYPSDAVEYGFDPSQGQALLEEAGWVDSNGDGVRDKNGIEFSVFLISSDAIHRQNITAMIADQMLTNCGIEVIPDLHPWSEINAPWPDGPIWGRRFDLSEFGWITGIEPPCDLYISSQIASDGHPDGVNDPGYANSAYDQACTNAMLSIEESDKHKFYGEAIKIFTQELPVLPLFSAVSIGLAAPQITVFRIDPTEHPLWNIEEIEFGESAVIQTSGGELDSPEDATTYKFGAGTFNEQVKVSHITLPPSKLPDFEGMLGIGHFFEVSAEGSQGQLIQPNHPYTLSLRYTDGELGIGMENTLSLYFWDEGQSQWVEEPTTVVHAANNTITAHPNHFSIWVILADTKLLNLPVIVR